MSAKVVIAVFAQVLLIQSVLSQCTSWAEVTADPGLIAPGAYGLGVPCGLEPALGVPYGLGAPCGAPLLAEPYGLPGPGYPYGLGALDFTPTSGGGLPVTSSSAIPPTGISVISDNAYEGILAVTGELPFVGTVAMEGIVPSVGSGAINHACGNGVNAMISDITAFAPSYGAPYAPGLAAPALGYGAPYAPGLVAPAPGYGAPWADRGCGYVLLFYAS